MTFPDAGSLVLLRRAVEFVQEIPFSQIVSANCGTGPKDLAGPV
jgi:hypothetical protein